MSILEGIIVVVAAVMLTVGIVFIGLLGVFASIALFELVGWIKRRARRRKARRRMAGASRRINRGGR